MNMKNSRLFLVLCLVSILFNCCELDNYDGPDATISGGIYDIETNELVSQDIILGVQIEYIELGWDNPQIQYMISQTDGTYRNNLMFSGSYTIRPVRGNFVPIDEQEIMVKGDTKLDFKVQPYIRIKNARIEKQNNKIIATFNLQQTTNNPVTKIGLYAHLEPAVGEQRRSVAAEQMLNTLTNENTVYTLEIDLIANQANLAPGKQYYFRIGAVTNAAESKLNYARAVRIAI
jgi:hypothetical protein